MSAEEFERLRRLILVELGIALSDEKRELLANRLGRRVAELGLGSFSAYQRYVELPENAGELSHMLDLVTTNETRFFRDEPHFEFLRDEVGRRLHAERPTAMRRVLRAWSAACSTGEEPYSIAVTLRALLPPSWDVEIVATDVSERVLKHAAAAVYPAERTRHVPEQLLRAYFLRGVGPRAGRVKVAPEIRRLVTFRQLNLHKDEYPVGPFDFVFCRNVLIYFDNDGRKRVVGKLLSRVANDGFVVLGRSESLNGLTSEVRFVAPAIYAKARA